MLRNIKKTIFILLVIGTGIGQVSAQQSLPDTNKYKLVWADEFNKDGAPDAKTWSFEHGFVRNNEAQWYQRQNAFCKNGLLIIEARRTHLPNPTYTATNNNWQTSRQFIDYTSSSINTRETHSWQYGRFVMRGRIDVDSGLWPAFWTLGTDKEWPLGGEIDIMEYYRYRLLANVIFGTATRYKAIYNSSAKPLIDFAADWSKKFHIWRMDWDENGISLYVDDMLLKHENMSDIANQDGTGYNPFMHPQYIMLNLAVQGDNGGDPWGTKFPRRFEVDYVRVYQKQKP